MNNESIPEEELKRIKADAAAYCKDNAHLYREFETTPLRNGYIDAAKAEYLRHASKPAIGLRWVKCIERLPKYNKWVIIRYKSGDVEEKNYGGAEPWWLQHVEEWLEEHESILSAEPAKESQPEGEIIDFASWLTSSDRESLTPEWKERIRTLYLIYKEKRSNGIAFPTAASHPEPSEQSQGEKTLGQTLKEARTAKRMSVENVLEATGVSNEYLRKLEGDELKSPSAGVLWKLSHCYEIDLKPLAVKAGIIIKAPPSPPSVKTEDKNTCNDPSCREFGCEGDCKVPDENVSKEEILDMHMRSYGNSMSPEVRGRILQAMEEYAYRSVVEHAQSDPQPSPTEGEDEGPSDEYVIKNLIEANTDLQSQLSSIKDQIEKEPMAFLLSNALRLLSPEQLTTLADSLYERTPAGSGIRQRLAAKSDEAAEYRKAIESFQRNYYDGYQRLAFDTLKCALAKYPSPKQQDKKGGGA